MFGLLAVAGKLLALFPGVASGVLAYLNKRQDTAVLTNRQNVTGDTTIAQAQLTAYVEERRIIAAERARQSESLWTAWMIPTAFALCIWHFGAIVLDSTHHFNWQVAKLPPPYDDLEIKIIWTVIGIKAGVTAIKRVFAK